MQDPQPIWELGRWIARREPGSATLSWSAGEIVLGLRGGRIHSAEGLDISELDRRLGCDGAGETELLAEARALAEAHGIPETRAMGTAKEILQAAVHGWLMDPDRRLDLSDEAPVEADGATISATHALVELVLADTEHDVAGMVVPDRSTVLQRSPSFLELYPPLRLSEEADLIVAGITGTMTADEVARGSSHHPDEVMRLIAALVATGVLEATAPEINDQFLSWPDGDAEDASIRRKIPPWTIGAAAVALFVVLVAIAWLVFGAGRDSAETEVVGSGDWGIVVEMGCEPEDLQRMLRKRNTERTSLRTIPADSAAGDNCFRLVWGSFANRTSAEEALTDLPADLVEDGFQPHVIEIVVDDANTGVEVEN